MTPPAPMKRIVLAKGVPLTELLAAVPTTLPDPPPMRTPAPVLRKPRPLAVTPRALRCTRLLLPPLIQIASLVLPAMRLPITEQPLPDRLMPVKFGRAERPFGVRPITLLTIWHFSGVLM